MDINTLMQSALKSAVMRNHQYVTMDHFMYALCTDSKDTSRAISPIFEDLDIDYDKFVQELGSSLDSKVLFPTTLRPQEPKITSAMRTFVQNLNKMHMLSQLTTAPNITSSQLIAEIIYHQNESVFETILIELFDCGSEDILLYIEEASMEEEVKKGSNVNTTKKEKTGALAKYCDNFSDMAKNGKITKLIGRENEIKDIAQILSRRTKNNIALVGEAGVGKTQIVEGLALQIYNKEVPPTLLNKQIYSLNVGSMLAGAKYRGDFEQRFTDLLDEVDENTILFIDEMHTIMGTGAGSEGVLDLANMLKPKLSRGELSVIGATTYDEYRNHFEKDQALNRRFMKVDVKEPTAQETKKILQGIKPVYEKHHKVKYSKDAIDAIITLSAKYIHSKFWPDKAIDLMDASAARNAVQETPLQTITFKEIEFEVSRIANIPLENIAKAEASKMKDLKKQLKQNVFGQDEAIEKLSDAVYISRAGLRGKNTTQGGYLFVGPSGVGKTEVAKTLANTLGVKLLRFDMSEFMEAHTVSKLIGSPPGYVGSDSSNGKLIDELDKYPDCVLLLDEVEKAHKDIFNVFLQVLDEGTISSSTGKSVNLSNVTVIMTTNLGSRKSNVQGIGFNVDKVDDGIGTEVKKFFRPEFLNRLDGTVRFGELDDSVMTQVAKKFIAEVQDAVKVNKVKLKLNAKAIEWIVNNSKEPGMGARPIKRTITENIKKELAQEMLFGSLVQGGTAEFAVLDGKLQLVKQEEQIELDLEEKGA